MSQILVLFDQFIAYSDAFKGNTPKSLRWLRNTFNRYLSLSQSEFICDFTQLSIENCIYMGRREYGWSAKTIRNFLQALSLFADWLVKNNRIKENPTVKIPKPKLPKTLPRSLTRENADDILNWTESLNYPFMYDRYRAIAIISTFLFTGIRLSELENLTVSDVNLNEGSLFVRRGKGLKDRFIPINERLSIALRRYLHQRDVRRKETPYFFTGTHTDTKLGDKVIPRLVKRIRNKSGIHFSAHALRHTFATLMLQSGCDIYTLSKLMGHSDIKTTTIYLLVTDSDLKQKIGMHPLNFTSSQHSESFPSSFADSQINKFVL